MTGTLIVGILAAAVTLALMRFAAKRSWVVSILAAAVVLVAVNLWGIPRYGYMACAWGGVAGYGTAMLLSYFTGQRLNPIPYPIRSMAGYALTCALLYWLLTLIPSDWPVLLRACAGTLPVLAFAAIIYKSEKRRG
jgi:O-antigen/teichoic acid export membrane protein